MRIAAVQHDIKWNDRVANFARLAPMIADAAAAGADLVLLSETFSTGFSVGTAEFPEDEGGPSSTFLLEQAAAHGVWVCGSCPEIPAHKDEDKHEHEPQTVEVADRRPCNTFVLAGPDGTVHRYRKLHPFTYGGEDQYVRPGTELITVQIGGLRVSPLVCYDLRFADEFWQLAAHTDVYLVPANWPDSRRLHWQTLLQARAIENQAYVVGCNRVGEGGGLGYVGDSRIIDPGGELLATAALGETVISADVTASRVTEVRHTFRFMQDRR
ncbi:MAG: nitrilase-related carbon-nitrogen hydrolase [Ilumatobacteraceae bacterium]